MRPGDKVRFLHSKGEGIIRKIIDNKNFEVEIEDGFLIPALRSDLVIVHSQESSIGDTSERSEEIFYENDNGGIWFCFVPFNDKIYSIFIVNDSSYETLFTLGEDDNKNYKGIFSGVLRQGDSIKITDVSIADFDKWPEYIFQCVFFKQGLSNIKEPLIKRLKFKANTFFKSKQTAPIINKEAYSFKLDHQEMIASPKMIVEEMFNKTQEAPQKLFSKPAKEVDLHIENLVTDFSAMSNADMLELQLKTFEKNLDNAIAIGMEEIIFIHGVGNGVLRQQIHKILSNNKNIQYYKDAQKEKFGYGATLVRIK